MGGEKASACRAHTCHLGLWPTSSGHLQHLVHFALRTPPRQNPGGTVRMNGVGERRHMRSALTGPSLRGREGEIERERERERERVSRRGVQQNLANLYFLP